MSGRVSYEANSNQDLLALRTDVALDRAVSGQDLNCSREGLTMSGAVAARTDDAGCMEVSLENVVPPSN
jgi:hypothetical protein